MSNMNGKENKAKIDRRQFIGTTAAGLAALAAFPSLTDKFPEQDNNLTGMTLAEASAMVRARKLSPVELTKACLKRIEVLNPKLNAFITVTAEEALSQAKVAEQEIIDGKWRSAIHGIPIALKDIIDTVGVRTTAASAVFVDRVPDKDAEVTKRLKKAGAIILGKLNMDEFAAGGTGTMSYWGPVHNPWALDHETGGSSAGSAAAIAADLCFATLGTDTSGSIRVPASHCSIVGLKPTFGRVSNRGVIPNSWSYDHVGPMCKTVEDAAIVLQIIAGYDPYDISTVNVPVPDYSSAFIHPLKKLRLGIPRAFFYDILEPDVSSAVDKAVNAMLPLVDSIQEVILPESLDLLDCGYAEFYAFHEHIFEKAGSLYQLHTAKNLRAFSQIKAANYILDRRALEERRREIAKVFEKVDVLVAPTVKYAPRSLKFYQDRDEMDKPSPPSIWNTKLFNIFGLPAISVPCGFTSTGLPVGVMIAGAPFAETNVLTLAHSFEQATKWHLQKPKLV